MALTAGSIEIKLFADIARLQSDMNKANKTVDTAMRNIDKSVSLAKKAFGGLFAGSLVGQVVKLADEYKKFDSQLRLSTKTLNEYSTSYENVLRISRLAQSDIGAIGVLYARLNNNLRDFNVTQNQVASVTETISLALRTNNATVQETNSVMLQLSQSFGSGKLNGQEFLAVAEGAPMLLRQLAKSLNVPYGALKDLSAQGKITREELLKAWSDPAYLAALRAQVKEVGTISSAITVLMNNLKQFVGEQDKATGASKVITSAILGLADSLNMLSNVAIAGAIIATGRYIGAKAALAQAYIAEKAALSAKTAADVVAARAQVVLTEAQVASTIATNAGSLALSNNAMATTLNSRAVAAAAVAQANLSKATLAANASLLSARGLIAALGGPIGAIITALGLAAVAFQTFGKSSTEALDALYEKARLANKELEKTPEALAKAVPNLLEQNAQRRAKLTEREIELQKQLDNLRAKGADKTMPGFVGIVERNLLKVQEELNLSLQVYNDLQQQRLDAEEKIKQTTDKAAAAEKFLRDQKINFLNEQLEEQRQIIKAAQEANLEEATRNKIIADAKKKMDDLTGATKLYKEESKQAKKDHEAAIKQAIELAKQEAKAYKEFLEAQKKARDEQVEAIDKQNEAVQKEIDKLNENIYTAQYGEAAFRALELSRLDDAIATAKQTLEQAKQNGATADAIKYVEDYITALEKQVELKRKASELESTEEMWKRAKKIEEDKLEAAKKGAKDLEKVNDRVAQSFSDALSNAIMRGFESGKSFAFNFRDTLILAFKSLVLRPIIDFIIDASGIQAVLGKMGSILAGGKEAAAASTASGGGLLDSFVAGGKSIFGAISEGFDQANIAFEQSIQKFGTWVTSFGSEGSFLSNLGGSISQYSKAISNVLPYAGSVLKLLSGDIKGAAFEGAGVAIGSFFGGPIGGTIGGFIGGLVGGLFGGDDPKLVGSQATGRYTGGKYTGTSGAFGDDMGIGGDLENLNKAFSTSLGKLLEAFSMAADFKVQSIYRQRTNVKGGFIFNGQYVATVRNESFQTLVNKSLGEGLIKAIKKSNFAQSIKDAFDNILGETKNAEDRAKATNTLINAMIRLQSTSTSLADKFGLTVDQAVKVADIVTETTEQLAAFTDALSSIADASMSVGKRILQAQEALTEGLGGTLPADIAAFDAGLKAIDKTTQEGIESFAEMLGLRESFLTFKNAMKELQSGVDAAIFSMLTPTEQVVKMQQEMSNAFTALDLAVPQSVQELIALGESIDYTTESGLNLAAVFPTLVEMFGKTQGAVSGLVNSLDSLNSNKFRTLFEFTRAQVYAQSGISLASLPSYAVGTSYVPETGPAMIHQGERIIPANENGTFTATQAQLVAELRSLREDNLDMRRELQSIALNTRTTAKIMDRQDRDGIIIRDVNNEGDPQILKVEIV